MKLEKVGGACEEQGVCLDHPQDRVVRIGFDFGHFRRTGSGSELFPVGDHGVCLGRGDCLDSLDRRDPPSPVYQEASHR